MIYKETFESNLKFLEFLSQEEREELFRNIQQKCKNDKQVSPFSIDEYRLINSKLRDVIRDK